MRKRRRRPNGLESRRDPIADLATFRRRLIKSGLVAGSIVGFSLAIGMAGYHWLVGVPDWLDCLLSASMILGGMGPIGAEPVTAAGKLFASFYAIYCGVILLVSVGLLIQPVAHRLMHRFHVQTDDPEDRGDTRR